MSGGDDWGYLAALGGFERMTASRLRSLLHYHGAAGAYAVAAGKQRPAPPIASMLANAKRLNDVDLATRWAQDAVVRTPQRSLEQCSAAGVGLVVPTDDAFPQQLIDDPSCPPVLYFRGSLSALDARRVGIVGTRNATQKGRETAAQFGFELAQNGVAVVSGLALGIDGAAHRGALSVEESRPVGVVGNGLDHPYPKRHADIWNAVAERGVLLSEWPPGVRPDAFRFPLRNRILAALVEVLVVVESRERGGSLITAVEAGKRDVEIMAVPGSVHSRASRGTNELLREGAAPANETADILMMLGLDHRRAGRARFDPRPRQHGLDAELIAACRAEARTIESLLMLTGSSLMETAMQVARLETSGWLRETGGWFEAVDAWADLA